MNLRFEWKFNCISEPAQRLITLSIVSGDNIQNVIPIMQRNKLETKTTFSLSLIYTIYL